MAKIILASYGIHTPLGFGLISDIICNEDRAKKKVLIITHPECAVDQRVSIAFEHLGFLRKHVTVFSTEKKNELKEKTYDLIYLSEGNTFELLDYISKNELISFIKDHVFHGADYIGISAGAHIAGIDIEAAIPFDTNKTGMSEFSALGLFPGVVIPHYDARDVERYLSYKKAKLSDKYEKVYTVADDEILVLKI